MARGQDCRCCCQDFALVEVWLVSEDGVYLQQAPNGKGPFALSGCEITVVELADGKFQATTYGEDLTIDTVFPTRTTLDLKFWAVEDASAPTESQGDVYEWGSEPTNVSGYAVIRLPSSSDGHTSVDLVAFALPDDCVTEYYAGAEGAAKYPWNINLFVPLNAEFGMAPPDDDLDDITETYREGIENYRPLFWDGRWGRLAGNLWMISQGTPPDESQVPQDGYLIEHVIYVGEEWRLVIPEVTAQERSFSVVVQRVNPVGDEDTSVRVTAYRNRGGGHGLPFQRYTGSDLAITHSPLRSGAIDGFSQHPPVSVGGQKVTIYRDGELVAEDVVQPTEEQLSEAMSAEGSYLIVSDISEDTNPESYSPIGTYDFAPTYHWRYHRQFASMVVDTTRPLVGFVPVDDVFADGYPHYLMLYSPPSITWFSSEPITSFPRGAFTGLSYTPYLAPVAGVYQIYAYYADEISDRAGNHPLGDGYQTMRLHAVPSPSDRRGAYGRLRMLGASSCGARDVKFTGAGSAGYELQTGFVRSAPLEQVELTLDRTLAADSVPIAADQFTLTANGVPVDEPVTVAPTSSPQRYVIGLPGQPAGSVCMLTWTPAGGVTCHDVRDKHYATLSNLPDASKSKWKVRYVVDGVAYTKTNTGYAALANPTDNPRDAAGVPYDPEPCVLACRLSWLVLPETQAPELIDTSVSSELLIGRHVSVDKSATEDVLLAGQTAVTVDDGMYLDVTATEASAEKFTGLGTFSDAEEEGFVPRVPPPTLPDPVPRYGYWGVPTTISPAPPGRVSPCAGPVESQPHSSVIRSESDITQFEVYLERIDEEENVVADQPLFFSYTYPVYPFADPYVAEGGQPQVLEAIAFAETTFTFTDGDDRGTFSQNTWVCNATEPSEDGIRIPPQYSWFPERIEVDPDDPHEDAWHTMSFPWTFEKTVTEAEYEALDGNVIEVELEHWTPGTMAAYTDSGDAKYYTVRQLKGSVTQDAAYGVATAYRGVEVYEGLSTAVLSELFLRVVLNVVLRAELHYTDKRSYAPTLGRITGADTISIPGSVILSGGADTDDGDVHAPWPDMEESASKTFNNRAIRSADGGFVFSQEQEAALAAGEWVQFIRDGATYGPRNRWNIKASET